MPKQDSKKKKMLTCKQSPTDMKTEDGNSLVFIHLKYMNPLDAFQINLRITSSK